MVDNLAAAKRVKKTLDVEEERAAMTWLEGQFDRDALASIRRADHHWQLRFDFGGGARPQSVYTGDHNDSLRALILYAYQREKDYADGEPEDRDRLV